MKRIPILFFVLSLLLSCKAPEPDLVVKGTIKDLNKGVLYLKQLQDTLLVTLDSAVVNGTSQQFTLQTALSEPEMLYLVLNDKSNTAQAISFFADKGVTEINSSLKQFVADANIKGSKLHKQFEAFNKVKSRFNNQNLELIQERFYALKNNDTSAINRINKKSDRIIKNKYLFAVNFAINHKDSQIAPYIALSEIYKANIKYLDTIYKALPSDISNSKYGKSLYQFITERKARSESQL